tara:strand:+ start:1366 stop:1695 length:330 start_codon:yes stop_codon:yes gene_type:complete
MKNVLGTEENLRLFNKDGKKVYDYYKNSYDPKGNHKYTEVTYDLNGNMLTYKNSKGFSSERTRDSNGKELTYKNSDGDRRGLDIPEYTMEELIEKLGNFKIINKHEKNN